MLGNGLDEASEAHILSVLSVWGVRREVPEALVAEAQWELMPVLDQIEAADVRSRCLLGVTGRIFVVPMAMNEALCAVQDPAEALAEAVVHLNRVLFADQLHLTIGCQVSNVLGL